MIGLLSWLLRQSRQQKMEQYVMKTEFEKMRFTKNTQKQLSSQLGYSSAVKKNRKIMEEETI